MLQVFPHGLPADIIQQVQAADGELAHTPGVLFNGDYRIIQERVEAEAKQGIKSKLAFKVLTQMIRRGLPDEPKFLLKVDQILRTICGESVGIVGVDNLIQGLFEVRDRWLKEDADKLPMKISHSASGLGTVMITKKQMDEIEAVYNSGLVGKMVARQMILELFRTTINDVYGLEHLTTNQIARVINNTKRGVQLQKPLNGQKNKEHDGRESSVQFVGLNGLVDRQILEKSWIRIVIAGTTENLTHGPIHYGNIANMGRDAYSEFAAGTEFENDFVAYTAAVQIYMSLLYGMFPPDLGGRSVLEQKGREFDPDILSKINIAYFGQDYRYDEDGNMCIIDLNARPTGVLPYWADMLLGLYRKNARGNYNTYADRFVCMSVGDLAVENLPESILANPELMDRYYANLRAELDAYLLAEGLAPEDMLFNTIGDIKGGLKLTVLFAILSQKPENQKLETDRILQNIIRIIQQTTFDNDPGHTSKP